MENNKKLIIVLVVFAVVMVGAYLLYSQLSPQFSQDQLATVGTQPQETTGSTNTQETTGATQPHNTADTTQEQEADIAPDFTVYDAQGNEVRLSDYFGKPIVLNFWASWCGPCRMEMPDFQSKYQELGNDVQFLMINMTDGARETVESASDFIAQKGYTFPVFFDTHYNAATTYSVYSLPMTFFINRNGTVVAYAKYAIDAETLHQGIDMIKD